MQDGPYRSSGAILCPKCSSALLDDGPIKPRRCSAGCGEWLSDAVFTELLCPVLLTSPDPMQWWKLPAALKCPWCGDELGRLRHGDDFLFRCGKHGTWVDQGVRDRVAVLRADAIRQFREELALAAQLAETNGTSEREIARRFVELEARVAALEHVLQAVVKHLEKR